MEVKPEVSFGEAIKLFFARYTDFSTRSRRSEYWKWVLFCVLVGFVIGLLPADLSAVLSLIWSLATLIPGIAFGVRRLHDIGKSGWWLLIGLIPLIGGIVLLVFACTDSRPEANRWGVSPKYY